MKNTNCEENEVLKRMLNTPHMPHIQFEAAALLRQCAEALRKEGV